MLRLLNAGLNFAESVSMDLEAFARHANRSTISVADVMLLTRRNDGLKSVLEGFAQEKGLGKEKEGARKN
ncbi:hypothetical protein KEM56_003179 [Ascosphaera pollenicola]|nr:hypothetical protein KEM56_003179 [Ascosphaera pollenicola]